MATEQRTLNPWRVLALAALVLTAVLEARAAPVYKVLHHFNGTDGVGPYGGVVLDAIGNLYGASGNGGDGSCRYGCGLVFEMMPRSGNNWTFGALYDFTGGADGAYPNGGLILDASGDVYATTTSGGAHKAGTAFELSPGSDGWTLTTLYAFCPKVGCGDGGGTETGLTRDRTGNLYGVKPYGASGNHGAVFELTPGSGGWREKLLHRFGLKKGDGEDPYAGLILNPSGSLYGTTNGGGNPCGGPSCGTVYELTPLPGGGWKEAVLHRFNGRDGQWPGSGALFMDGSGGLYGTTTNGGSYGGVVFKLTPKGNGRWKDTTLYEFQGGASGWLPGAGVVMDKAGNLYGTTDGGGSSGCGVLYRLAPSARGKWTYRVLHTFGQGSDGCEPEGNLTIDSKGNLYGGAVLGGEYGYGVVFELTP
jgi:uncharacterized repeat protein (TIGR03803 family)